MSKDIENGMSKDIENEKQQLRRQHYSYLLAAVSSDMYSMVRLEYSSFLDHGGHDAFYQEMEELLTEVMFGSTAYPTYKDTAYEMWLSKKFKSGRSKEVSFKEMHGECFDWYHMTKVRKLFVERHEEYKCKESTEEEVIEEVAMLLALVDDPYDTIRKSFVKFEKDTLARLKRKVETLVAPLRLNDEDAVSVLSSVINKIKQDGTK